MKHNMNYNTSAVYYLDKIATETATTCTVEVRLYRARTQTRLTRTRTRTRILNSFAIKIEPKLERGKPSTAFEAAGFFLL